MRAREVKKRVSDISEYIPLRVRILSIRMYCAKMHSNNSYGLLKITRRRPFINLSLQTLQTDF
jgi:hypothetical protein